MERPPLEVAVLVRADGLAPLCPQADADADDGDQVGSDCGDLNDGHVTPARATGNRFGHAAAAALPACGPRLHPDRISIAPRDDGEVVRPIGEIGAWRPRSILPLKTRD